MMQSNGRGRPSWGWQSLMVGRDFLRPGLRWLIGSGLQVDTLQDHWLPGELPLRPHLRRSEVYLPPHPPPPPTPHDCCSNLSGEMECFPSPVLVLGRLGHIDTIYPATLALASRPARLAPLFVCGLYGLIRIRSWHAI
ncbi:hypothetical protein LINPERHAP2_LOCUS21095 [Linum perenne]